MQKEAEIHADEDKKKKEIVEAKNIAENLAYTAEKTLKESPNLEKFPLLKKELEKFNQNVHLE